jgi:2-C-methyl-D-erythritol 4-phosphate cytidylyltransferase
VTEVSNPSEPVVALVVAAGSGVRLGGGEPKALRLLAGKPLVAWSIEALVAGGVDSVVLVVAAGTADWYGPVVASATVPTVVVLGGATRQESVASGLAAVPEAAAIVLVHDAARPLVPATVVAAVVAAVRGGATAVIPVVPVTDSIRRLSAAGSVVVDREELRAVQTPQGFRRDVLVRAHAAASGASYTDDATVCEAYGEPVTLVQGSPDALKVTHPLDLAVAEMIVRSRR